jgi:hypothetical protein
VDRPRAGSDQLADSGGEVGGDQLQVRQTDFGGSPGADPRSQAFEGFRPERLA